MNFFRRNIGGGSGHSNNNSGGGSADNLISASSKHHDMLYTQNKFGSSSLAPNMTTDFTSDSIDQKDNLARNCREFYERRVRMAEIASQRWGERDDKTNLVQQGQTSPSSLVGSSPMIITTSDVTSSISSSSRDDSSSSYKESSANSSDHESSSHPVLPLLPPSSSTMRMGDKRNETEDVVVADIYAQKSFLKCATLPNRKSSSTKKNDMRTSTMLKKRKDSSSAGSIATDEDDEEIRHVPSSSGSESCSDKLMSTRCDGNSSSGLGSSLAGGRTSSSSGSTSNSGGLFDPDTLPSKIADLRRDLLSLITLDNELFKNLLSINDTIEEMREQKMASSNNLQVLSNGNMENSIRGGNFILNGGRQHKRSKSSGKVSKSHASSKCYENSTDDSCGGGSEGGRSQFFEVYENQQKSLTILNDEDEEEEDQDQFNGNGFLSIGNDYFSSKEVTFPSDIDEDNSAEPYDLRYHHTFASLPVDQTHFSTSNRSKISSTGRRTSSSNDNKVAGSGNTPTNNSSITTFDGLAKFMLRSRSFLLRPSRSSSKTISMPPSFSSGNGNLNSLNRGQNGSINNSNGSTLFSRKRISLPINNRNGSGASASIGEETNIGGTKASSGTSKIPIKIGSRSRSRSRDDGTASTFNKQGPQSLPFHILQSSQSGEHSRLHQPTIIDEVEIYDTMNNNNVRHISTMPRQGTNKRGGGSKGRKLSQPNSTGQTNIEPTKSSVLSSSRYNSQVNNRKSNSTSQSTSISNNIGSTNVRSNSQGAGQGYPLKYSSLTLERDKPSTSGPLNHRTTSYQRPLFHLPHQTRSKHLWQKVFVQATSVEDGTAENEVTTFSVNSPGSLDVPDANILPANTDPKTTNVTTKHVKQNSFDSGIADAAHYFSSARGSHKTVTCVLSD